LRRFSAGLSTVAAISLSIGLPTVASVPHVVLNAFKNLVALSLETGFEFDQMKAIKDAVDNPDAYKAPETTNIPVTNKVEDKKVDEPVEEVKEEKEESDDMGFSFFDE